MCLIGLHCDTEVPVTGLLLVYLSIKLENGGEGVEQLGRAEPRPKVGGLPLVVSGDPLKNTESFLDSATVKRALCITGLAYLAGGAADFTCKERKVTVKCNNHVYRYDVIF